MFYCMQSYIFFHKVHFDIDTQRSICTTFDYVQGRRHLRSAKENLNFHRHTAFDLHYL